MTSLENANVSFTPQFYSLRPEAFRDEANAFMTKATALASEILDKDNTSNNRSTDGERTIIIRNYYSPWYNPFWFSPWMQPVYVISPDRRGRNDREDDNATRVVIGVLAAIIGGIALYSVGASIPRYLDSKRELEDTKEFQSKINAHQTTPRDQGLVNEAKGVAALKGRICSRIKNSAALDLALRVGVVFGCSLTLISAFIAGSGVIMTAGIVTSLVAGGGMLFKLGFDTTDKQNIRDAKAILNTVQYA